MNMVKAGTELGILADPAQLTGAIDLSGVSGDLAVDFLEKMLLVRFTEEAISDLIDASLARTPCHLCIGQEAISVGLAAALRSTDRVFGGHRSHGAFLAMGGTCEDLLAEVLGKATGCSRGMGGSMHLQGRDNGFWGSVPIVAATVPVAVGAGLAAKMDGRGDVAVPIFGDGAAEQGGVHEALNLAATHALPVVFVCENNLYASHMDIRQRQPSDRVARFGEAHRIPTEAVDGNDVVAVYEAARRMVERARAGGGPSFLETVTYRLRGHVGPREDIDVGIRRNQGHLEAWRGREPIKRLAAALLASGIMSQPGIDAMSKRLRDRVTQARSLAETAPYPEPNALLDLVYAGG